jgi:hypothetical protein
MLRSIELWLSIGGKLLLGLAHEGVKPGFDIW